MTFSKRKMNPGCSSMQLLRLVIDHPTFSTSPNDHLHPETQASKLQKRLNFHEISNSSTPTRFRALALSVGAVTSASKIQRRPLSIQRDFHGSFQASRRSKGLLDRRHPMSHSKRSHKETLLERILFLVKFFSSF